MTYVKFTAEDFISVGEVSPHKMCFTAAKIANQLAANANADTAKTIRDLEEKLARQEDELKAMRNLTDLSINGGI